MQLYSGPLSLFFAAGFGASIDPRHRRLHAWIARVSARPSVARELGAMSEALVAASS